MFKDLMQLPGILTSTATLACIRKYGTEILEWDPLIVRDVLEDDIGKVSQRLFDKVNCGLTILGTNGYTQRLEVFVPSNSVMSGRALTEGSMGLDDPHTLAWGVWEAKNLNGDIEIAGDPESDRFTEDIRFYTGRVLLDAGISEPPTWLSFAEFDPEVQQRISDNTPDPEFYLKRQTGLKNELNAYVSAMRNTLIAQLKLIDQHMPLRSYEGKTDQISPLFT